MALRWPWSDVERAKKSYRLFCERPVGGNGLETLQAVSVQLKQMDDYLKSRREGKTGDKPGWMKEVTGVEMPGKPLAPAPDLVSENKGKQPQGG